MYNKIGFSILREMAEYNLNIYKDIKYANYDEIYEILPKDFIDLKDKELKLEKETLYANPQLKEIFDYAKQLNKKIILISDMYFSSEVLEEILHKNGYFGYEKIYVSSEIRKAKYDASIFKYVIEELNIDLERIIHIGDHKNGDYKQAKSLKINAFLYTKPIEQLFLEYPKLKIFFNENSEDFSAGVIIGVILKRFILGNINKDYWNNFGYLIGGPLCYGLTKFVHKELIKENIKDIIFVARDGYTIEKIFNLINKENINSYYIYAPRSMNIIINMEYENSDVWKHRTDSFISLFKELDKDFKNTCPNNFKNYRDKINFIEKNKDLIKNISQKLKKRYIEYIKKFNIKSDKLAIFDVSAGSFNSMKLLTSIFPNTKILGLYFLIYNFLDIYNSFLAKSYQKDFNISLLEYEMLEFIVTAPQLPVKYIDDNLDFVSINNKYEQIRKDIYQYISEGEILFSSDLLNIFNNNEIEFSYITVIKLINSFILYASKDDIKHFDLIKHGVNEDHTLYKKLINFKKFKPNKIFSFFKDEKYKILYILGIKITIKNK